MVQNLHLMYDEKVITRTIHYFDLALPGCNKYIVLVKNKDLPTKHVKVKASNVYYVVYDSRAFWEIVGNAEQYKNIIYHFLGNQMVDFTIKLHNTDNLVWIVWGADFYNLLLKFRGYELYSDPSIVKQKTFSGLFSYYKKLKALYHFKRREKAIMKIPYICIGEKTYDELLEYYPQLKHVKRRDFFYYPVDDMVSQDLMNNVSLGNNIFVGNSASYTNNHFNVFRKLEKYNLGDRKVYVPLSYGSAKDIILKEGYKLLKEKFHPITEFLSLEEYNKLMLSAGIFIYGNYRSEAFGNIVVALYIGAVVVLDSRNALYKELKDKGFTLFSLENLDTIIDYHLTKEERNNNRNLINKLYSKERLIEVIKDSFGKNINY